MPIPWWIWPPNNWKLALLLREIDRDCAPPLALVKAKTVYIDNQNAISNAEGAAYLELKKWGRFEIVSERGNADLLLTFSTKPPAMDFDTWYKGDPTWAWLKEAMDSSFGYSLLKVSSDDERDAVVRFFVVWADRPDGTSIELLRQFRKTIKQAEKWYARRSR
jgi:hypothetical protein